MEQLEPPNTIDHMLSNGAFQKNTNISFDFFGGSRKVGGRNAFFLITIGGRRKVPGGRPAAAKMPLRLAIL